MIHQQVYILDIQRLLHLVSAPACIRLSASSGVSFRG